ncbi:MAG: bifunctional phosphoglucose/phosphomannose isomerase [Bacteroidota bacterium]
MKDLIAGFAGQMKEAIEIGSKAHFTAPENEIRNILLIGLGGSAFGGEVTRNYVSSKCPVPFEIVRDYTVPGFVSEHTLLIASSYSGNTEETLSMLEAALPSKPKVVCVTSGGQLLERAKANGWDHIVLPGGYPPRSAAGFSIIQQLFVLRGYGLIDDFSADLDEAVHLVDHFEDEENARLIAEQLHEKIPILYSSPAFESIAIRWRQQIEENSKHIAFHHVIPEMNHNELVGWKNPAGLLEDSSVVVLRSPLDHVRTQIRMDICREIFGDYADGVIEVNTAGENHLSQLFYLLHLGDWVSWFLAELNGEDATPVEVIDFLKGELAKHK